MMTMELGLVHPLVWVHQGAFGIKAGEYRIATCLVMDVGGERTRWRYALYHKFLQLGIFNTADEAKAAANEHSVLQ